VRGYNPVCLWLTEVLCCPLDQPSVSQSTKHKERPAIEVMAWRSFPCDCHVHGGSLWGGPQWFFGEHQGTLFHFFLPARRVDTQSCGRLTEWSF